MAGERVPAAAMLLLGVCFSCAVGVNVPLSQTATVTQEGREQVPLSVTKEGREQVPLSVTKEGGEQVPLSVTKEGREQVPLSVTKEGGEQVPLSVTEEGGEQVPLSVTKEGGEQVPLSVTKEGGERVPLYVKKARLLLQRQKAYERTMQARMTSLTQSAVTFTSQLYLRHVSGNRHDNVLVSPLSAFASMAMVLTASQGRTKREVLAALALHGEGRGVHTSVQRALASLLEDDTDDVNDAINNGRGDLSDAAHDDEPPTELSDQALEDIVRNDYLMDTRISYNTGQTHIAYSTGVTTGGGGHDRNTSPRHPGHDLHVRLAHGMFHSEDVGLSQHFSNRLVSLYGAPPMAMQPVEPETSVNLWVDAVTRGTVPDMLGEGSITRDTLLVLVSAVSFWGQWETNFDERETIPLEFQTLGGDSVLAQCMYRTGNYSLKQLDEVGAKVLELPYANARYSLFVFLPHPSTGLYGLERSLKTHSLSALVRDMPDPAMTIVLLPKFHLRARVSLASELRSMGVRKLFGNGQADLRRMTEDEERRLYVNDVFQYAALEVNEGTKSHRETKRVSFDLGTDQSPFNSSEGHTNSSDHEHISDIDPNHEETISDDDTVDDWTDEDDDFYDYYDYEEDFGDSGEEEVESGDSSDYFIADKPFLFMVKDKQHDLVLLMGRVANPLP